VSEELITAVSDPLLTQRDRRRVGQAAQERAARRRLRRARREHEVRLGRHRAARPGAIAQAPYAAPAVPRSPRASRRAPGDPRGQPQDRSNDTEYAFRASTEYAYLTGDQTEDGVLVLEPTADGHKATIYCCRAPTARRRVLAAQPGELWVGRRHSLTEAEQLLGIEAKDVRELAAALAEATGPVRNVTRPRRRHRERTHRQGDRRARRELRVHLSEARA